MKCPCCDLHALCGHWLSVQVKIDGCAPFRWQEISLLWPRCDLACESMPMVSMLDSPRMVCHTHDTESTCCLGADLHAQ